MTSLPPSAPAGWGRSTARDTPLGRDVAIKVVSDSLAGDPGRLARFEREAKVLAALNHPHIVTIFSIEEADGVLFLTMELVEGRTLALRAADVGSGFSRISSGG